MEISQQYLDDEVDYEAVEQQQYMIKGTIHPMPEDSLRYYHQALGISTMSEDDQALFLPYYIVEDQIGDTYISSLFAFLGIAAVLLMIAVVMVIMICTGRFQKRVKAYIANSSNSMIAREKIESFLNNTPVVNGLQFNRDFICGQGGASTVFGETDKLVWAYQQTTTHKRYFITVGKTDTLMLVFTDGSRQSVTMKKAGHAEELLASLAQLCPRAIIGYHKELEQMAVKNFSGLLDLKYNKPLTASETVSAEEKEEN